MLGGGGNQNSSQNGNQSSNNNNMSPSLSPSSFVPYVPVSTNNSSNSSPFSNSSISSDNFPEGHHIILENYSKKKRGRAATTSTSSQKYLTDNIHNNVNVNNRRLHRMKSQRVEEIKKYNQTDNMNAHLQIDGYKNGNEKKNLYTLQEENINRANNIPQLLELFYHSGGNLQIPELIREHLVDRNIILQREFESNRRRGEIRDGARRTSREKKEEGRAAGNDGGAGSKDRNDVTGLRKKRQLRRRRLQHDSKHNSKSSKSTPKSQNRRNLDYMSRSPSHSPTMNSTNYSNSSNNNTGLTPTPSPIIIPWSPSWSWLPGYSGGNGPILRMQSGFDSFEGCLFFVGAFNDYPAIALWRDDPTGGSYTMPLPSKRTIQGFITAIVQVSLPFEDIPIPIPAPRPFQPKDYTLLILLSCVMVGVMLGALFAICCNSQGYTRIDSDENNGEFMMGIPLKTLSGGANYSVDFRECFERAMKARHLPTHESLLIINPKEIVLSKIIGEGSFGRVWNGQWRNNSVAVKEFVFAQAAIVGGSLERNNIIEEIVGEAGVMACLRHPKILQLYGCSLTMQAIWIVSEFCSRGSLRMLLNDSNLDLPLLKRVSICLDVADGMLYLHTRSPPIIHRDIKSHNIFITEPSPGHFVAKIGDWGSARAVALTGTFVRLASLLYYAVLYFIVQLCTVLCCNEVYCTGL